jgi:hypothetical protein
MLAEGGEHVIEKANPGRDLDPAGPVEVEAGRDVGLGGGAPELSATRGAGGEHHQVH